MAQGHTHARQELVDAERLGQVVVGAEVERRTLSRSAPRTESTMIGVLERWRTVMDTCVPSRSGRLRSRMIRSGRKLMKASRRLLPGLGFGDAKAVAAEVGPDGAQDRRLVVDYEDARAVTG